MKKKYKKKHSNFKNSTRTNLLDSSFGRFYFRRNSKRVTDERHEHTGEEKKREERNIRTNEKRRI